MSLKINTLPDAPKPSRGRFQSDLTFQIKGGYQENKVPVASSTLVFVSDDEDVVTALAEKFGGEVENLGTDKNPFRLISDTAEVDLVLDSPDALQARFALYGQSGLVFATDGEVVTEGETYSGLTVGEEWAERPETLREWKDRANKGRAPKPDIKVRGKIVGLEELGFGQYRTSGWSLVADLPEIEETLKDKEHQGEIHVRLSLGLVEYKIKNGPKKGDEVSYTRPYLTVL